MQWRWALLLFFALGSYAAAQDKPPILNCTKPEGADARTVVESQRAWAKHLGEKSHEKTLPLDKAGWPPNQRLAAARNYPITVIVPARNDEADIGACLRSLAAQENGDGPVEV
ncbi:MAG: hypothetical protein FJ303_13345 [Planctomycetes bacterium]|nr:hypothetical protein [Planctomycetota bacterium]